LAGTAMGGSSGHGKSLIGAGGVLIAVTAVFFGVQHFLHPLALPRVPLEKLIPPWVPPPAGIDYLTGAALIRAWRWLLLGPKTRVAATWLGAWIVLLVLVIYGPVLIGALADPSDMVKVEGVNYFADTLLFGGTILSLARAMTASD